jgi:diguanylate cyclase (GGDEF)-like protein
MLVLDVSTAFAICGAAALVGACMLPVSAGQDEPGREAVKLSQAAFGFLGLGLLAPVFSVSPLPMAMQALMVLGSLLALLMLGWAVSALAGRLLPRRNLLLALAAVPMSLAALWSQGPAAMVWLCALGLLVLSALMLGLGRHLLWRPRDRHEQAMGVLLALVAASSALRASFLFTLPPPYPSHLLHVPAWLISGFAVMYGVLPIIYVVLMLNIFNARLQARLVARAMTDDLTGVLSRRALAEGAQLLRQQLGTRSLAVVMIDLDHFKRVNDRWGHAGGDRALREASSRLAATLRGGALLARYGGEEFVALVPVDDMSAARRVAERMRETVAQADWPGLLGPGAAISASLGVTLLHAGESIETALARADEALYRAKSAGRNQVQVALTAA